MAQTKIKAGLFEGIIGNGTDGYFLMSNGDGTMTWSSIVINPTITDVDYPGTVTAADPAGGETITLTGTGFKTGATVTVGGTSAPSVSYVSETQITFTTPAKTAGDYDVVVTNTDTGSATFINGISFNGIPAWTTAAGSLGTFASGATISTITLQATEPDAGTITFNITNGALPTGLSLTGANIDGTTSILNADTLYTFTVTATDDENQATPRTFTITVQKEFISSENFTINTYTGNGSTQSIEGKIGTAALFNGVNPNGSVIDLPDLKPFFTQKQTVSLSMWFNAEVVTTDNTYLFSDYNSNSYNIFAYLNTSGVLVVSNRMNGQTNNFISSSTYNDSQWYHLVVTNDVTSSVVTVYINGSSIGTNNISSSSWSTGSLGKLGIGAFYSTTNSRWQQSLKGKIDQVRIFDKVLSSSEVTTLYGESNTSTTKSTTDIFADGSGVALYEFEKGAIDTGGTNGYIGSAGVFDGSSSLITTPVNSDDVLGISMWIYFVSGDTSNRPLGCNISSGNPQTYIEIGTNGVVAFSVKNTARYTAAGALGSTGWKHLYVDSSGNLYINGSSASVSSTTFTGTTNIDLIIGALKSNFGFFNSKIDQVRFFSRALTSSEVTTLYGETSSSTTKSTTDIFDDGSGVALYELEGNANDTGGASGKFGAAAHFNGSTSKIDIGNQTFLNSDYTLSMWFYPENVSGTQFQILASKNQSDDSISPLGLFLYETSHSTNAQKIMFGIGGGGSNYNYTYASNNYSLNQWNFVAVKISGTSMSITLNGTETTATFAGTRQTNSGEIRFGNKYGSDNDAGFGGKIDDIRIYSDALTSTEIGYIYNNTTASIPTDNLEAYYKLDGNSTDEQGSYDGTDTDISYRYDGTATNVSYAYDGTPTDVSFVGTSFQPDLVWVKNRTGTAYDHKIADSVRGATKIIESSTNDAEVTATGSINAFNTNGFTIGTDNSVNGNGNNFVAWCWKAGGTAVTNTDGSTNSTVSANQEAGFSVVKTSNTGGAITFGHGLSQTPELIINKGLTNSGWSWLVYHKDIGTGKYLVLNSSSGTTTNAGSFSSVTSTTITNNSSNSTSDYINYCFHSVTGYQKIGSYTQTSSGTVTVDTGLSGLRWVMAKGTGSNGGSWVIIDTTRGNSKRLFANVTNAESTTVAVSISGSTFSIPFGSSGNAYGGQQGIYLAIA